MCAEMLSLWAEGGRRCPVCGRRVWVVCAEVAEGGQRCLVCGRRVCTVTYAHRLPTDGLVSLAGWVYGQGCAQWV